VWEVYATDTLDNSGTPSFVTIIGAWPIIKTSAVAQLEIINESTGQISGSAVTIPEGDVPVDSPVFVLVKGVLT